MLYIEKKECPAEIADEIHAIKETTDWKNIPNPSSQTLPEEK